MDTNNWNPAAPASEPAMENGNWRSQSQSDSRQRIVNQLMETLKKHIPFSGPEGLQELEKVAMRFEENIYAAATSQSDYLSKTSLKMLIMETKSQDPLASISAGNVAWSCVMQQQRLLGQQSNLQNLQQQIIAQQSNLSGTHQLDMQQRIQAQGQTAHSMLQQQNVIGQLKQLCQSQQPLSDTSSTSLDLSVQTGHANGGDWQEEVYQRIKTMKETYLPELNKMYQKIVTKLQQLDSLPQQPTPDQRDKLKIFKTMLERVISFLQVPKNDILPGYKEKLGSYEKQILHFINTTPRPRNPSPPQKQGQVPHSQTEAMPQQQPQISQMIAMETEPQNPLPNPLASNSVGNSNKFPEPGASLDSTAQSGHSNGGDWQEEVYQKIKTMKETYLPGLNKMYQKIVTKLQQHDSLPQQPKLDQLDKLKIFNTMLERIILFLQVSKTNILPGYKEKLGSYEKQIIHILTTTTTPRNKFPDPAVAQSMVPQVQNQNQSAPDPPRLLANQYKEQLLQQVKKQKVELLNLKETLVQLQVQQQNLLQPSPLPSLQQNLSTSTKQSKRSLLQ